MPLRFRLQLAFLLTSALLAPGALAPAQVLARPGWAGAGMAPEPWWRSAVFYRIAPEHFQDSDGDGMGDLRGVAQRLDYLQALGVDAVVLQLPFDDTGFDDLLAGASRRHIRLVIGLHRGAAAAGSTSGAAAGDPSGELVAEGRHWLARGAAGILLPEAPAGAGVLSPAEQMRRDIAEPLLLLSLRRAAAQMPGERVVIPASAAPSRQVAPMAPLAPLAPMKRSRRASPRDRTYPELSDDPQLILNRLPITAGSAVTAADVLAGLSAPATGNSASLLQLQLPRASSRAAVEANTSSAEVAAAVDEEAGRPGGAAGCRRLDVALDPLRVVSR